MTPPLSPEASPLSRGDPSIISSIGINTRRTRRLSEQIHHPANIATIPTHQRAVSETAVVRYRQNSASSSRDHSPSPRRLTFSPRILHASNRTFSPSFLGLRADNIWTKLSTTFESVSENTPTSPVTPTKMFTASSAQAQAGPDLEELQTEVCLESTNLIYQSMSIFADVTVGCWLPISRGRNKASCTTDTMANKCLTKSNFLSYEHCFLSGPSRGCRT